MLKIGFIGFGGLGQLLGNGFIKNDQVSFYDPNIKSIKDIDKLETLEDLVNNNQVIIIATPSSSFEDIIRKISKLNLQNKLIVDVLSTKTRAIDVYQNNLMNATNILSLHPLFGPPSINKLIPGLKIVSVLKTGVLAEQFEDYLSREFKLDIIRVSAVNHDKHMAVHHAIPFLLAHALSKTDFNKDPGDLTIPSEEKLRQIVDIAENESLDLYYTIMKSNPYTEQAIDKLVEAINQEMKLLWDAKE